MMFEPGDIAVIKKTGEEGVVLRYIDEDLIEIEIKDVSFPISVKEVEMPYLKWFQEQREKNRKTSGQDPTLLATHEKLDAPKGFHLGFSPVFEYDGFEDVVTFLKVYFINQNPFTTSLHYQCRLGEDLLCEKSAMVPAFDFLHVQNIEFSVMNSTPKFWFALSQNANKTLAEKLEETIRIKPKRLFQHIGLIQKSKKSMFYLPIAKGFAALTSPGKELGKVTISNFSPPFQSAPKPAKSKALPFIDLHLESLAPHVKGLSNFEILTLQLNALEEALHQAINAQQQSLIVIHGLGAGKLKEEVHKILRSNFDVDFFIHDWTPKYGNGATEVFFKQ